MLKPKTKRTVSLAIALVFLFTVIMPMSAFAADNDYTKYSSTYTYVKADDEIGAGTATVKADEDMSVAEVTYIQVKLTLPSGVEFSNKPGRSDVGTSGDKFAIVGGLTDELGINYFVKSDSRSVTLKGKPTGDWDEFSVKFNFAKDIMPIDIDSDFTGNLDATIEVWGLSGDAIVWSESDTVTIAKVSGSDDVMVTVGDAKSVTKGKERKGADIKVYETQPGNLDAGQFIVYDILTDGVTFNDKTEVQGASFKVTRVHLGISDDGEQAVIYVNNKSSIFPGDIVLTPYFDIDPGVSGDIKVRVSSADVKTDGSLGKSNNNVSRTTVVPATVGDTKAVVDKLEDNDTVAYSGQLTELDVEITIKAEGGAKFKQDDTMEFTLNVGEFAEKPNAKTSNVDTKLYNSDKSFYVSFNNNNVEKFTLDNFDIILPNDVEPGDITLTIDGDYGDLGEVTIGVAAAPVTLSAEKTPILAEALNQKAGDITITETGDGALKEDGVLVLELPSGIELNGKPKLDVVEGNFDGDVTVIDDKYIAIEVEKESSDASEIKLYNINYDTGRLALNGDVELKAYFIDRDVLDNDDVKNAYTIKVSEMIDEYDDTGVIARVANATVANENEIVATFAVGDEGVAVVNGRTLVQVNKLCDVLGMQKSWDEVTKTAYFVLNGKVVAFPMGENAIYINGTKIAVDQGGKIINDFTYATLRGIQMAFGGDLEWDDATKTATFKFVK